MSHLPLACISTQLTLFEPWPNPRSIFITGRHPAADLPIHRGAGEPEDAAAHAEQRTEATGGRARGRIYH